MTVMGFTIRLWNVLHSALIFISRRSRYTHVLFSIADRLATLLADPETTFGRIDAMTAWFDLHPPPASASPPIKMPTRPSRAAALTTLRQYWPRALDQDFILASLYDGTISESKLATIASEEVKALGNNRFTTFMENNEISWREIFVQECQRLVDAATPGSWAVVSAETLAIILLQIDHRTVPFGTSYLTRSGIEASTALTVDDVKSAFSPNGIDMRKIDTVPGWGHNLAHMGRKIIACATGNNLHPELKKQFGSNEAAVKTKSDQITAEICVGMGATSVNGDHTFAHHVNMAFADPAHSFRSTAAPVRQLAALHSGLVRHYTRRGRLLHDNTLPEFESTVTYGENPVDAPHTVAATRCGDDDSELAFGIGLAGAVPLVYEAVTNNSVTTCSNYWASQRATLPQLQLKIKRRRDERQRMLCLYDSAPRDERPAINARLHNLGSVVPVQAVSDMHGETANPHFSRYTRRHNRYSVGMLRRAKNGLAQKWLRERRGALGKLQNRMYRKGKTLAMKVHSNTLVVTPDAINFESTLPLARRTVGRGVGEFVHSTKKTTEFESESESCSEEEAEGSDSEEDNTEERSAERGQQALEADLSDMEEDGDEDAMDDTQQFEVQCDGCKRWKVVSRKRSRALELSHTEWYCSPTCRVGGSVEGTRVPSASSYHDQWMRQRLHDVVTGRVAELQLAQSKREQNERNQTARVGWLKSARGDNARVVDLSTNSAKIVVYGQGACTLIALPELRAHLGERPDFNRAKIEWDGSRLPPTVSLALVGWGGIVISTVDEHAVAELAQPHQLVRHCLAIELRHSDWVALDVQSKPALARLICMPTTKTSGVPVQTTCIGGEGGLCGDLECPVCGCDLSAMPAGIDLPRSFAAVRGQKWTLATELVPVVNAVIASQVHNALDDESANLPAVGAAGCKLGKALAAKVTGGTIRTDLAETSSEWMRFIDGVDGSSTDGDSNMEKQLLHWLRSQVTGGRSWGKPRLLEAMKAQLVGSDGTTSSAFQNGDEVLAHWMVDDPTKRGAIIVDPKEPNWLRATV
eukprot:COSAG05_NODE_1425_length_4921_cov_2.177727_1_plen_1038_part_10